MVVFSSVWYCKFRIYWEGLNTTFTMWQYERLLILTYKTIWHFANFEFTPTHSVNSNFIMWQQNQDQAFELDIGPCGMKIDWNHKCPQHYISCYLQSKQIHDKYIRYLIIITLICLNFFNRQHFTLIIISFYKTIKEKDSTVLNAGKQASVLAQGLLKPSQPLLTKHR